jgi:Flp pilus assembly protein TadG
VSRAARRTSDEGSVLVEFVLVSILVVIIALGIVQLSVALHVRNMLTSAASEGARFAAAYDRDVPQGVARTHDLASSALGDYPFEVEGVVTSIDGAPAIQITVNAPVPVFGLWGVGNIEVDAHALKEVSRD